MLIVEDQACMRRALADFVQSAYPECTVVQAADGRQALKLCASACPRLVLMDVALPDANGIELIAPIRNMLPETEVIIVSQHTAEAYVERARLAGASAYISKDNIYRDLLPAIARALDRKRPPLALI